MSRQIFRAVWLLIPMLGQLGAAPAREIPRPLASHPGNIFIAGEPLVIPTGTNSSTQFRLVDYQGRLLRDVQAKAGKADLGLLDVGYYELLSGEAADVRRISFGVLQPLRAATPLDSPV